MSDDVKTKHYMDKQNWGMKMKMAIEVVITTKLEEKHRRF